MSKDFWNHTIWYLGVFFLTILILSIALLQSKHKKKDFAFYFSVLGVAFYIEAALLFIFNAYEYSPKILKNPFDDTIMGNLISQTVISAAAIFIIKSKKKWYWYWVFMFLFCLIEDSFLKLDIYNQIWYKTWYTAIGLFPFFAMSERWYSKLKIPEVKPWIKYITIYMGVFALFSPTINWIFYLTGIYSLQGNFYVNHSKDHTAVYLIYGTILINIILSLFFFSIKLSKKIVVIASVYFLHFVMLKTDILLIRNHWFFFYITLEIFAIYILSFLFNRLIFIDT